MTNRAGLLHVHLAEWEYQCCEAEPEVGQHVHWEVVAIPAQLDDPHVIRDVTWVEALELVRFEGGSASRQMDDDDARDAPVTLYAGWHWREAAVTVKGVITDVVREVDGAVIGLRVDEVFEPTPEAVAEVRRKRDVEARTVRLTGPTQAFGKTMPTLEQRLVVDLDDKRLVQQPKQGCAPRIGMVSGVVRQVSRSEPTPSGGRFHYSIEVDGPLPKELFIALVCDA